MPSVGLDCMIVLDGAGYFVEPETFTCTRARVRAATVNRQFAHAGFGAGERYVDHGPGKRQWSMLVQCFQALRDYTGGPPALSGQQQRDALHASYEKVGVTLPFTDPSGRTWQVHFDHLEESIANVRAQADGALQYHVLIDLVEA